MFEKTIEMMFTDLIDLLFPKKENVRELEEMKIVEIYKKIPPAKDISTNLKAVFSYKYPFCKTAIWEIKYKANKIITRKFANILYEAILEEMSDIILFNGGQKLTLVPIPVDKKSLKEKGFNQSNLLTQKIFEIDGGKNFAVDLNILEKIKETEHQVRVKNRLKRLENLIGCFSVKNPSYVKGKSFIVVDDVITTGATMTEVERALKTAGAKNVYGFSIAH
jgi:ComF family protein